MTVGTVRRMSNPLWRSAMEGLQAAVNDAVAGRSDVRVLEAGCGSAAYVEFPADARITGIDIDEHQLAKNTVCDETILGDIETYDLPPSSFDAVVCWYVFEHLDYPDHALVRFARAVRPGGVIVLALPNLMSPKGLLTKYSPLWVHIAWKRYVIGHANAGKPGCGPFPTTLPWTMTPERLLRLASSCDLEVVFQALLEDGKQVKTRRKIRLTGRAWDGAESAVRRVSRGRLDATSTELLLVLRRPADA